MFTLLSGILLFIGGVYLFFSSLWKAIVCRGKAVGTIIRIQETPTHDENGPTGFSYSPVIEFDTDEMTVSKKADISANEPDKFQVGSTVDILYNRRKPEMFIIKGKSTKENLLFGILAIPGGALLVYLGYKKMTR